MNQPTQSVVVRLLLAERAELVRKRDAAAAPFERDIAEIDAHLELSKYKPEHPRVKMGQVVLLEQQDDMSTTSISVRRAINQRALDHCFDVLDNYMGHMKSSELHESVVNAGIHLQASDPAGRLVQLLSGDDRFKSVRGLGWTVKGEASAGTEASGATTSGEGE